MIVQGWLVITAAVLALAWYLVVGLAPPDHQSPPGLDSVERYRDVKMLPAAGALELSAQIGHEVFDIPAQDAVRQTELAASPPSAGGMTMGDSEMQEMTMAPMQTNDTMERQAVEEEQMASAVGEHTDSAAAMQKQGAEVEHREAEEMHAGDAAGGDPEGGHGGGRDAGITVLAQGSAAEVAAALQGVTVDRTVAVAMNEWTYDPMSVNVGTGEVIRLVVRHDGSVPHEFMLMDAIGMDVVDYRLERADWNLLEHVAISERPIVMPGDVFELVFKVDEPGMYMYMCMFPKHMEFGMMGMMMAGEGMM